MITLITGVPGSGKTAYAVKVLRDMMGERPVFSNINGLQLDHFPIDHEWVQKWHENAPPDALIVIDECQHSFRPRPVGSKVPENVAAFETHRHLGVDFILITQRPTLIDSNIRGLTERHIHVRQTALSRMIHEAPEVVDWTQKSVRQENASRPYKLPRDVFSLYKSASHHTAKPKKRLPNAAYMLLAAALGLGYLGYSAYASIDQKLAPTELQPEDQATAAQAAGAVSGIFTATNTASKVPDSIIEATTPKDPHNPLSAPLYAAAAPEVVIPEVQGCIASDRACTCYNQQATPVWIPEEQCRQRAAGRYFDPYRNPPPERQTREATAPRQGSEATAPVGGSSRAPQGPEPSMTSPPPAGEASA